MHLLIAPAIRQYAEHSCVLEELELLTVEVVDIVELKVVIEGVINIVAFP